MSEDEITPETEKWWRKMHRTLNPSTRQPRPVTLPDDVVSRLELELSKLGESPERVAHLRKVFGRVAEMAFKAGQAANPPTDWKGLAKQLLGLGAESQLYPAEVLQLLSKCGMRRLGNPEVVKLCIDSWSGPQDGPKPRSVPGVKGEQ